MEFILTHLLILIACLNIKQTRKQYNNQPPLEHLEALISIAKIFFGLGSSQLGFVSRGADKSYKAIMMRASRLIY